MNNKKILVTGGLGFIGSHTVVALQEEGFEVVIIDNLSNTHIGVLDQITAITGTRPDYHNIDMRNEKAVHDFFSTNHIEGVIHFAAFKAVGESVEKPLAYYENNLSALIILLKAMEENKVSNFIFSSSCTVYGQADELPITEKAPVKPAASPYGYSKQVGEIIIRDTCKVSDLKAIALRYFNPIGAHESINIGELPLGIPQNLIPFITQTAAGIREELQVFGDDYPTEDGTAIRDYIHVVDLALAHTIALKRLLDNQQEENYEFFNIGTGKGSFVMEIIKTFEKVSGQKLHYKIVERRAGDITAAYADTTIANEKLGWKAQRSLATALESAWKWQQEQKS